MSFAPDLHPKNSRFTFFAAGNGKFQSFYKEIKSQYLEDFSGSGRIALPSCPGAT